MAQAVPDVRKHGADAGNRLSRLSLVMSANTRPYGPVRR